MRPKSTPMPSAQGRSTASAEGSLRSISTSSSAASMLRISILRSWIALKKAM
jgi:hypothetical protein